MSYLFVVYATNIWLSAVANAILENPNGQNDEPLGAKARIVFTLGTDREGFDDDTRAVAAGEPRLKSPVVIWINEEPVSFYDGGGILRSINEHVRVGVNTISFTGRSEFPLYVKVTLGSEEEGVFDFSRVIAKKQFIWKDAALPDTLKFELSIPLQEPKFDNMPVDKKERATIIRRIETLMEGLREDLRQGDFKTYAEKLESGRRIWAKTAYGHLDQDAANRAVEEIIAKVSKPGFKVESEDQPLMFVWGAHSALVYVDGSFNQNSSGRSLRLSSNGKDASLPPLQIVLLKGDLVIWKR